MVNLSEIFQSLSKVIGWISPLIYSIGILKILEVGWKSLNMPNVSVEKVRLVRYFPMNNDSVYTDLRWKVHNKPRFRWFGEYLVLPTMMFFIGRGDKGEWHWSGTKDANNGAPENLPIGEKTLLTTRWINEDFPEDEYRVYIIVLSEEKVIYKKSFNVPLEKEGLQYPMQRE